MKTMHNRCNRTTGLRLYHPYRLPDQRLMPVAVAHERSERYLRIGGGMGNKYDYRLTRMPLNVKGTGQLFYRADPRRPSLSREKDRLRRPLIALGGPGNRH